jgi:hypothetical protein
MTDFYTLLLDQNPYDYGKEFFENYPQFWHMQSERFASPILF